MHPGVLSGEKQKSSGRNKPEHRVEKHEKAQLAGLRRDEPHCRPVFVRLSVKAFGEFVVWILMRI